MRYFDSHSHYYDGRFETECETSADELIGALLKDTVSYIVNVGTSAESSRLAAEQARRHDGVFSAIGIHPSDTRDITCAPEDAVAEIRELILDPENKCVALGEIGLDYHYPETDKEKQKRFFHLQMQLAGELSFPVVIHDRDAHGDVMDVIRSYPDVRGVLHSYSGSAEMAKELIARGYYISFSGTITFKNARVPREVAATLPRDRILIETDAPYLAPHPERGTLNHSGKLKYTNASLASVLGISEEECAALTEENAKCFFGIKQ